MDIDKLKEKRDRADEAVIIARKAYTKSADAYDRATEIAFKANKAVEDAERGGL